MSNIVTPRRRVWTRQPKDGRSTLTPLGFTSFVATGLTHPGNLVGGAKRSATRNGLALDTRMSAGDREVIQYNPGFALSGSSPFAITLMLSDANYWATGGMVNYILGCADAASDGTWYVAVQPGTQVIFAYIRVGGQPISVSWPIADLTGNKIITIVRESNVGYGVWRAVVNGIDYGTSTSGSYGSGEISVGPQSLHIGATALQTDRGLQGYVNLVHVARGKVPSLPEIISVHTNPWQIFTRRERYTFVTLSGGSASYTITPTGSISLSGISTQIKNKIFQASGTIQLTGSASLSLTNGAIEYIISPSGFITYSGTYKARIVKSLSPSGTITYSGNAIRSTTHIQTSSGLITFSGSAPLYVPGSYIPTTSILLTGVGK